MTWHNLDSLITKTFHRDQMLSIKTPQSTWECPYSKKILWNQDSMEKQLMLPSMNAISAHPRMRVLLWFTPEAKVRPKLKTTIEMVPDQWLLKLWNKSFSLAKDNWQISNLQISSWRRKNWGLSTKRIWCKSRCHKKSKNIKNRMRMW